MRTQCQSVSPCKVHCPRLAGVSTGEAMMFHSNGSWAVEWSGCFEKQHKKAWSHAERCIPHWHIKKNIKPWQFLLRVWVSDVPDVRLTVPTPGIQECKPTQDSGVLATVWNPGVQTPLFRRMEALFVIQLTEIVNLGSKTCPQIVFEYMYVY